MYIILISPHSSQQLFVSIKQLVCETKSGVTSLVIEGGAREDVSPHSLYTDHAWWHARECRFKFPAFHQSNRSFECNLPVFIAALTKVVA